MPNMPVEGPRKDSATAALGYVFASSYRRNFPGNWGHITQTVRRDANKSSAPNNVPFGVLPDSVVSRSSVYQCSYEAAVKASGPPPPPPKTHAELLFSSIAPTGSGEQLAAASQNDPTASAAATKLRADRVRRKCALPNKVVSCNAFASFDMPALAVGIPYTFAGVQALRRLAEIHKLKASRTSVEVTAAAASSSVPTDSTTTTSSGSSGTTRLDEVETIPLEVKKARPSSAPANTTSAENGGIDEAVYKGIRSAWIQQTTQGRRRRPALQQTQYLVNLQNGLRTPWHKLV